jgi:sensor histidine kinase regulating citrate/malate metabolism
VGIVGVVYIGKRHIKNKNQVNERFDEMIKRLILILFIPIIIWVVSLAKCEIYTVLYGHDFKDGYKQTHMLCGSQKVKVLKHSDSKAEVYYVNKEGGDIISFKKVKDQWIMEEWNTIWSRTGSADGFMWPYIR